VNRVYGLVFSAIFSVAIAFALPPPQTKQTHKALAGAPHSVKPTVSSTGSAHRNGVATPRTPAKPGPQLRTVSTRSSSGTRGRWVTGKASHGRHVPARPAGPSYQTHPDEDRYREIQQALIEKGYFKGEVNGQWGPDSTEALQKFQLDNKLPDIYSDGKINSLSLIGLGLGPKHGAHIGEPVPTPPLPPPPTTLTPDASSSASTSSPSQPN
jgi:hypothetical protein